LKVRFIFRFIAVCCLCAAVGVQAQPMPSELKARIDATVQAVMDKTGVPSA
jgi:hypothetical protein